MNSKFPSGLPPILDPYDNTAAMRDGGQIVLDIGQIFANASELLERHLLDPSVDLALSDIFGDDANVMVAFLDQGLSDSFACHIASEAARLARQLFPLYRHVNWAFLDSFDPHKRLNIGRDEVHLEPLDLTREIARDHYDPNRQPKKNYGVDDLTVEQQSGIILGSLIVFICVCHDLRRGPRS